MAFLTVIIARPTTAIVTGQTYLTYFSHIPPIKQRFIQDLRWLQISASTAAVVERLLYLVSVQILLLLPDNLASRIDMAVRYCIY